MDDKSLIRNLLQKIDSLDLETEEWSESKIDFLKKYGHL